MAGPVSNQGAKDKTAEADKTASATTRRTQPGGSFGPLAEIMVLQRTIGNQAVGQWLAEMSEDEEPKADSPTANPAIPSAAAGEPPPASKSPLQPKLKISQPNDPAELE